MTFDPNCPRPDLALHATKVDADKARRPGQIAYACKCGGWHTTRSQPWTTNAFTDPVCVERQAHQLVYAGVGYCCVNDARRYPAADPTVWRGPGWSA